MNYRTEATEAMRREKQQDANQTDNACGQASRFSPLRSRLHNDLESLRKQHYESQRALDILTAHPEFEDLIELLGLIRTDVKVRPVSSYPAAVLG